MNLLFRIYYRALAALTVLIAIAVQAQPGATIAIRADQPGAATLQQTTNLSGSWTTLTNAVCPIRIPEAATQKFYRLAQ